jgi:hypothetical protein
MRAFARQSEDPVLRTAPQKWRNSAVNLGKLHPYFSAFGRLEWVSFSVFAGLFFARPRGSRAGLATCTTKARFSCRSSTDCAKPPYQLNLRLLRIDLSNEKAGLTKVVGSRATNLLDATQIPAGGAFDAGEFLTAAGST